MKMLLITLEYPPQKGGVASYYVGVVSELKRRGHEVVVKLDGLLSKWVFPRWLNAYFALSTILKKEKPDVIAVGNILPLGTVAYLLRRKIPYIVFVHGTDILWTQKYWWRRWMAQKILARAKLVVANSEFTRSQLTVISSQFTEKSVVVYPCPNMVSNVEQAQVEALRRKLGLNGKKVLLTLGRVVARKGYDTVLRALPEILRHVPNVVYVVAGDGPDLERLQNLVARGFMPRSGGTQDAALQNWVRFVGEISDEERAAYFALCDLFVMPSRQIGPEVEGFGIVYLEAALFGKPSIGGRSGGVPEAILDGKTGALVDPTDASAFARVAVQFLRDDRAREELGKNARARVLDEFTWEKQVEKLVTKFS